jgi:hypothetical protein
MTAIDRRPTIPVEVAERIAKRKSVTKKHSPHIRAYRTKGGSYLIANPALGNDDDVMHDLVLITWDDEVVTLRPTVNPNFVEDIVTALAIEAEGD